jgi:glycosyltransferase involved in cell wall biosynthesis
MADKILVFIPCYNCEPQIGRVMAQFKNSVARYFDEILILDNGSSDRTVEVAMRAAELQTGPHPRVIIARNRENYGLGGSHKSAYCYAAKGGFSHVVTLHGDDQGDIRDIEPILANDLHNRFDACVGARFQRGSKLRGYSMFRIVGNHVFNILYSVASLRRVTDMGSGLNILGKSAYTDPTITRHSDDLHFNPRLLLNMFDKKMKVHFFPITWREDDQVSNVKMASQALQTLAVAIEYVVDRNGFRNKDHRRVAHSDYIFDVLSTVEAKP